MSHEYVANSRSPLVSWGPLSATFPGAKEVFFNDSRRSRRASVAVDAVKTPQIIASSF